MAILVKISFILNGWYLQLGKNVLHVFNCLKKFVPMFIIIQGYANKKLGLLLTNVKHKFNLKQWFCNSFYNFFFFQSVRLSVLDKACIL